MGSDKVWIRPVDSSSEWTELGVKSMSFSDMFPPETSEEKGERVWNLMGTVFSATLKPISSYPTWLGYAIFGTIGAKRASAMRREYRRKTKRRGRKRGR